MAGIGIRKTAISLAVAGAFAGGVSQAHASAFALIEQSASGLGNSYAGAAATAYDPTWVGRFQAIKSDISTFNVNPSVSYKVDDKMSFGFGLNYQHIDAELSKAVVIGANTETIATVKGKDDSWGFNAGAMFQP